MERGKEEANYALCMVLSYIGLRRSPIGKMYNDCLHSQYLGLLVSLPYSVTFSACRLLAACRYTFPMTST
jgi:hypothetical protein